MAIPLRSEQGEIWACITRNPLLNFRYLPEVLVYREAKRRGRLFPFLHIHLLTLSI